MSLNASTVFRRTDLGVREVYEKSHHFTRSERLILVLLDGRLDVGALRARLPSLDDARLAAVLAKLRQAGLVEPASPDPAGGGRLDAAAVAHYLEQTQQDPVTRLESGAGAASRTTVASPTAPPGGSARKAAADVGDMRSGANVSARQRSLGDRSNSTTQARWDAAEATQFAITTIAVPDRLDLQEERDRAETREYQTHRRLSNLRRGLERLLIGAVLIIGAALLYGVTKPLVEQLQPARVAAAFGGFLGVPLAVESTELRISPSPRLMVRGIEAPGQFRVEEVALLVDAAGAWRSLLGGRWAWREAIVSPMSLSPDAAYALLRTLPAAARELPASVAAVRLRGVEVVGSRLLAGRFEGAAERTADGRLGPMVLSRTEADGGSLRLQFAPGDAGRDAVEVELAATQWRLPAGPAVRWPEIRAQGTLAGRVLEVSNFALTGFYGVTTGTLYVAADQQWVVTGSIAAANIDIESVLQRLRGDAVGSRSAPLPLQGTADVNLALVGRGASLDDAVGSAVLAGPFQVRWATLTGVNLGLVAAQGARPSGSTKFTDFQGMLAINGRGLRFEDTGGRAGALTARSSFLVSPDLTLNGTVRVELGGQRVQAPITLKLRGTVLDPRFGD